MQDAQVKKLFQFALENKMVVEQLGLAVEIMR